MGAGRISGGEGVEGSTYVTQMGQIHRFFLRIRVTPSDTTKLSSRLWGIGTRTSEVDTSMHMHNRCNDNQSSDWFPSPVAIAEEG